MANSIAPLHPNSLCRLHLFRHGETDWNREQRFQGHTDIPLNATGREQAQQLALILQQHRLEALLASDLSRARDTAKIVAAALQLKVFEHPGLREAHLGDAQGLTYLEIEARFGADIGIQWRSSKSTDADISYPGGESGVSVTTRAFAALEEFVLAHPEFTTIGVATHGGVIRRIMQKLLPPGSPPVAIPNACLHTIHFEPNSRRWSLP